MAQSAASNGDVTLSGQGLILIYRRLIAVGAASIVAGTSLWELPFPRGQFFQAGLFFIAGGFIIFALVMVVEEVAGYRLGDGPLKWLLPVFYAGSILILVVASVAAIGVGARALADLRVCILQGESDICTKRIKDYTEEDRRELKDARALWSWPR